MKKKMNIASGKDYRNLSHNHYTTLGFGQVIPSYAQEVVAGDELIVKPNIFSRSSALDKPNMAHLKFDTRAFYVTYSSVWKYYEDFLQANPVKMRGFTNKIVLKQVPRLPLKVVADYVVSNVYNCCTITDTKPYGTLTDEPFDFSVNNGSGGDVTYLKLTQKGKRVLHILQCLGYNFNLRYLAQTSEVASMDVNVRPSVLPLACFLKVIYDYYIPSNLRPSSGLDLFFTSLNELEPHNATGDGYMEITLDMFANAFDQLLLYHDQNYFTSQWLYPDKPVDGLNNFQALVAWTPYNTDETGLNPLTSVPNAAVSSNFSSDTSGSISSFQITDVDGLLSPDKWNQDSLILMKSLRTFIMRNNLIGSRPIQRLFARFGVKVPELQLQMAEYHGHYSLDVMNIDVVSQGSDTETLGEMAGKSFVVQDEKDNKTFKFNCKQNGWCFLLTSVDVPSTPVSGLRRNLMHITPFDFYTPEFDNSVLMACRGDELLGNLFMPMGAVNLQTILTQLGLDHGKIFGYMERYSEMKFAIDRVTGDYNVPTLRGEIEGFIMPRDLYDVEGLYNYLRVTTPDNYDPAEIRKFFYYVDETGNSVIYNPTLLLSQEDSVQFNRIYKSRDGEADPFNVHFVFDAKAYGPVKNNSIDSFVSGDGKSFEFEKNGSHMN